MLLVLPWGIVGSGVSMDLTIWGDAACILDFRVSTGLGWLAGWAGWAGWLGLQVLPNSVPESSVPFGRGPPAVGRSQLLNVRAYERTIVKITIVRQALWQRSAKLRTHNY